MPTLFVLQGKFFTNRLSKVVGDLLSFEKSTFVHGRQILDGQMILNEVISWRDVKKNKVMVYKVDFLMAYDFVR